MCVTECGVALNFLEPPLWASTFVAAMPKQIGSARELPQEGSETRARKRSVSLYVVAVAVAVAAAAAAVRVLRRKVALRNAFRHAGANSSNSDLSEDAERQRVARLKRQEKQRQRRDAAFQWPGSIFHFCSRNDRKSVEYLLSKPVKDGELSLVDCVDMNGRTGLHWAAAAGSLQVCQLLLQHARLKCAMDRSLPHMGDDVSASKSSPSTAVTRRDRFGLSAMDHARICGHLEIVNLFRELLDQQQHLQDGALGENSDCFSTQIQQQIRDWILEARSCDGGEFEAHDEAAAQLDNHHVLSELLARQSEEPTEFWRRQPVLNTTRDLEEAAVSAPTTGIDSTTIGEIKARKICHMTREVFGPGPAERLFPIPPELKWDLLGDGRSAALAAHINEVEALLTSDQESPSDDDDDGLPFSSVAAAFGCEEVRVLKL